MIQVIPDNEDGTLSTEQISTIINNTDLTKFTENNQYFTGNNPTIAAKADPTNDEFPNNKIPVPYGRKLSLTTSNYMFNRPVIYTSQDQTYIEDIKEVFFLNDNDEKINTLGLNLIIHGVSYKLFYFKEDQGDTPSYTIIPGSEIIPVYDFDIEPNLICVIRFYVMVDIVDGTLTKTIVETYYKTIFRKYEEQGEKVSTSTTNSTSESMILVDDTIHGFQVVPAVVYGDSYQLGVFDAVKKLIDGIDTITSTDLNEIEKFALAYLVLTNATLDQDDADAAMEKRLFQLPEDATMDYLTKQINDTFNGNVLDFLVSEVHKQSGVPDFASKDFAAESGIALQYKLMGFENLAASIEYLFKKGEQESIDIINSVLFNSLDRHEFILNDPDRVVKITMSRNIPEDTKSSVEIANLMSAIGISKETIFDQLTFIDDVEEEIKRMDEEKEKNMELFGPIETKDEEEPEEDKEDEEEK